MAGVLALECWNIKEVARVESCAGLQLDLWIIEKLISHSIEKRRTDSICVLSTVVGKMKQTKDTNDPLLHIKIICLVFQKAETSNYFNIQ